MWQLQMDGAPGRGEGDGERDGGRDREMEGKRSEQCSIKVCNIL